MGEKGISRNGNSWTVRIYRNGKSVSTSFADVDYGNEEKSLEAAKSFREKVEEETPPSLLKRIFKKGKTLPPGVSKTFNRGSTGNKLPCFTVSWRENDVQKKQNFKYEEGNDASEEQAKQNAITFAKQVR
jgi:hypothetical protein